MILELFQILNLLKGNLAGRHVHAHSLLELILCVGKCTVGSSGTAPLLTKVSAHAGLVLAVGLRLQNAQIRCEQTATLNNVNISYNMHEKNNNNC